MIRHRRRSIVSACAAAATLSLGATAGLHAQKTPAETVASLKVADGFEVTLWAAEPDVVNPTNMDIDERGRVWITEAANYRGSVTRPEGDRIVILEDTDNDGKADSSKVFFQDKSLFSPLGICKVGNKLYVSQSPNVIVFTIDESGDKPVGKPEIVYTGFTGENHDHGVHAFVFGPDGRFYFNAGNDGCRSKGPLKDGTGKEVLDTTGSHVPRGDKWRGGASPKDRLGYQEGMAFRVEPDGSGFETLGFNFRNNYEVAPDSFGTAWQSDNDDDGNEGVRINYVMEGGNFGFKGPRGTDWGRDAGLFPGQTKQEAHWHLRWPGIVPNVVNTGGGSPCGILVYEGDLVEEQYRGALVHCDAGPNVVRAYIPQPSNLFPTGKMELDQTPNAPKGAGYEARAIDLVKGGDTWFRPCDVAVAPDGSILIADWYDPGVGGHATGDRPPELKGRVYRLAPTGMKPGKVNIDSTTVEGAIAALKSPNLAARYLGYQKLANDPPAVGRLKEMFASEKVPQYRARALWLLARSPGGRDVVTEALGDADENIRVTAFRAARLIKMDVSAIAKKLLRDPSPFVLREIALAMNYQPDDKAVPILVALADKYDGTDRWFLEAIGIGAQGREQALLNAWKKDGKQTGNADVAKGLEWRLMKQAPGAAADARTDAAAPGDSSSSTSSSSDVARRVFRTKDGRTLPPIAQLVALIGDAARGAEVFRDAKGANCIRCHEIGAEGQMIGPPLNTVGEKLSKSQLYEAILCPSDAILMEYENWIVRTKAGQTVSGLKVSDTPLFISIKDTDGKYHDIDVEDVERQVMQKISIMPENLSEAITQQELVDLVEYLTTLRNKA